jgi:hypothetical protein
VKLALVAPQRALPVIAAPFLMEHHVLSVAPPDNGAAQLIKPVRVALLLVLHVPLVQQHVLHVTAQLSWMELLVVQVAPRENGVEHLTELVNHALHLV